MKFLLTFILSTSLLFAQGIVVDSGKSGKTTDTNQEGTSGGIVPGGSLPDLGSGGLGASPANGEGLTIPEYDRACVFNPPMSDEDRTLMTRAQNVIAALRSDADCPVPAPAQLTALSNSITAFNDYAGLDSAQGTPNSGAPLNCHSFEATLDRRFDQFVRNVDGFRYHFPTCSQPDSQAAIECAMNQVATEKSRTSQRCAEFQATRTGNNQTNAAIAGYQDVIGILSGMIENRECGNQDEVTRANLLNLGLNLAGRASSFIPVSGGQVLISGVTQLAQVAIRAIFGSGNDNLNNAEVRARKSENFRNLACAYQEVEKRALNCDRIVVNDNVDRMQSQYNQDLVTCGIEDSTSTSSMFDFLNNFDQIAASLRPRENEAPPEPNIETGRQTIDFLRSMSRQNIPGTQESYLDVGLQSAERVADHYNRIATDPEYAGQILTERGLPNDALEIQDLRLSVASDRQKASEMLDLLRLMQQRVNDPSNLTDLQQRMAQFQGNFRESFAQILQQSAGLSGSLSEQIDAHNGSVAVLAAYGRIEEYRSWRERATTDDDHARSFSTRLDQMQPDLRRATTDFLEMSRTALAQVRSEDLTNRSARQSIWEQQVKPALLACNNLRSGMVEFPNFRQRNSTFNAESQRPICSRFNCENGIKTFGDHLRSNNLSLNARECNMGDCRQEYNRFLCRVDEGFDRAMDSLKNEFLESGRVCNNSVEQLASTR